MLGLIARREFLQIIRSRGFWLTTIGTPLMLMVMMAVTGLITGPVRQPLDELIELETLEGMIGFVDKSGIIQSIPYPAPEGSFQSFDTEAEARSELEQGHIVAYYVIPDDYGQNKDIERYSLEIHASAPDNRWMSWILIKNLLPEGENQRAAQLRWPFNSEYPLFVNLSGEGQTRSVGVSPLPLVIALVLISPLLSSGTYFLQSLSEEKRDRIIEILVSSTDAKRIFWGKLFGLGFVAVVQYVIWIGLGILVIRSSSLDMLTNEINLTSYDFIWILPFAIGGYLLYAGLMAGIGAITREDQNSRAWLLVITLPLMLPLFLWPMIVRSPNGPLAVGLSMFPLSSPVGMLMRTTATDVPDWQILLSAGLLIGVATWLVFAMAKLFRANILIGGEKISLRRAVRSIVGW